MALEGSGCGRPQGPRHQLRSHCAPPRRGCEYPGLGTPPSQCFSRAGWAPGGRPMAACMSRAGLISDNKVGRRAGVQGAILKSAVGGEKVRVPAVGQPGSSWSPACRDPLLCLALSACLAGAGGHRVDRREGLARPLCQTLAAGAELPCKYPRFTRFMTSLAVKFATSSMEHTGRGTDRNRERD